MSQAADWLHIHLSVCWSVHLSVCRAEWQQRCIMGQGEEPPVRGGRWAGRLVEPVGVEPERAALGEGGGVTWRTGAQSGPLDDLLTVLQGRTSENQSHNQ